MIFLRGKASHLYGTGRAIWGLQRKLKEHLGFFEDDSNDFGEIPGNRRNLQEGLG